MRGRVQQWVVWHARFVAGSIGVFTASLAIGVTVAALDETRLHPPGPPITDARFGEWLAETVAQRFQIALTKPTRAAFVAGTGPRPAIAFSATSGKGLPDIYRTVMTVDDDHRPFRIETPQNLTKTPDAAEGGLAGDGMRFAFSTRVDTRIAAVNIFDFSRGEGAQATRNLSWTGRLLNAVTNLQHFGATRGVGEARIETPPGISNVALSYQHDRIVISYRRDGETAAKTVDVTWPDLTCARCAEAKFAPRRPEPKTEPMLADWVVNRIRDWPFFGEKGVEWLEAAVLSIVDDINKLVMWVSPRETGKPDRDDGERVVEAPLPKTTKVTGQWHLAIASGWPPPPVPPVLSPAHKNEGQWVDIYPYGVRNPGAPPALLKTIVRTDPKRDYSKVRLIIMDARQVDLGFVAGTKFPETTTGQSGDGVIPRDKRVLRRLVGAFNGGFKTMHGAYGMMVAGKEIVRPRPNVATVAKLKDGRLAFGTWPVGLNPALFESYRQNLPPLIENRVINPTGEKKWGVTPIDDDPVYTYRSAIGVTKAGHLLYAWGNSVSAITLALAMVRADCTFAIHLDMNWGHTRFEFYRVYDNESLAEKLPEKVHENQGIKFQARKMDKDMISWLFPRYLKQDDRDFFYLTLRPPFPRAETPSLAWSTDGWPAPWRVFPTVVAHAKTPSGRILKLSGSAFRVAKEGERFNFVVALGRRRDAPSDEAAAVRVLGDGRVAIGRAEDDDRRRTETLATLWGDSVSKPGRRGGRCVVVGVDAVGDLVFVASPCDATTLPLMKDAQITRAVRFETQAPEPIRAFASGRSPEVAVEFNPMTGTATERRDVELPTDELLLRLVRVPDDAPAPTLSSLVSRR